MTTRRPAPDFAHRHLQRARPKNRIRGWGEGAASCPRCLAHSCKATLSKRARSWSWLGALRYVGCSACCCRVPCPPGFDEETDSEICWPFANMAPGGRIFPSRRILAADPKNRKWERAWGRCSAVKMILRLLVRTPHQVWHRLGHGYVNNVWPDVRGRLYLLLRLLPRSNRRNETHCQNNKHSPSPA